MGNFADCGLCSWGLLGTLLAVMGFTMEDDFALEQLMILFTKLPTSRGSLLMYLLWGICCGGEARWKNRGGVFVFEVGRHWITYFGNSGTGNSFLTSSDHLSKNPRAGSCFVALFLSGDIRLYVNQSKLGVEILTDSSKESSGFSQHDSPSCSHPQAGDSIRCRCFLILCEERVMIVLTWG
jgi:hypothetical protein